MSARTPQEIRTAAEEVQAEITDDMTAGTVPTTVRDFAELHDYVDANEYGGFTDPARRASWSTDDLITVQNLVHQWLENKE